MGHKKRKANRADGSKSQTKSAPAASNGDASSEERSKNGAHEPAPSEAAYQKFLDAARALDRRDLREMRGDPALAYTNASRALDTLLTRQATIDGELPRLQVRDLAEIPEIAQAVMFAELEVQRAEHAAGHLDDLMRRARKLRKRLLGWADEVLASDGASELAAVRNGEGAADTAEDCVALARLLAPHVSATQPGKKKKRKKNGKSRLSPKKLTEAADVGAELARTLRPGDQPNSGAAPEVERAVEMRDRLWTLLRERYVDLWRAGAYLFGPTVDERLPTLQSRRRKDHAQD